MRTGTLFCLPYVINWPRVGFKLNKITKAEKYEKLHVRGSGNSLEWLEFRVYVRSGEKRGFRGKGQITKGLRCQTKEFRVYPIAVN